MVLVGSSVVSNLGSPPHVSTLSGRVNYPIRPVSCYLTAGGIRFLGSLTPSWASVHLTMFLLTLSDPVGVTSFRMDEIRSGWSWSLLRGLGVHQGIPLETPCFLTHSHRLSHFRWLCITKLFNHSRPNFPSPPSAFMADRGFGFPSSYETFQLPGRPLQVGTGLLEHLPVGFPHSSTRLRVARGVYTRPVLRRSLALFCTGDAKPG
jgi:hypothetical protein